MPSRISPYGQCPAAKRTIASTSRTPARPSRKDGGVIPNQRGSLTCIETGTGPVSSAGTSTCSVRLAGCSSSVPHSGQNRARIGTSAPQCGQASVAGDALTSGFCPGLQRF